MDEETKNKFAGIDERLSLISSAIKALGQSFEKTNFYIQDLQKAYNNAQERVSGTQERLDLDEERIAMLERHDDTHLKNTKSLHAMIDAQSMQIDSLMLDSIRLHQAYYHVFPDRLEQDSRFEKQLDALIIKPSPDADPKKT